MTKVLVGTTGSIGAKDTVRICAEFKPYYEVRLIASARSLSFFDIDDAKAVCETYTDDAEWYIWKRGGDPILHIDLRNWADVLVVAPMTANTLSKFANGLCDNLLTTVFRAWQMRDKPIFVAPSMNKFMWEHPSTQEHLDKLRGWGINVIPPRVKWLAGGDFGPAALADIPTIIAAVASEFD